MKNKLSAIWLALICIIVFILQVVIPGFTDLLLLNKQALQGEVWRFVTSIFLHASLEHLIFNLFALVLFGLILEKLISTNRFLIVFFASGIIANIFSVNFYDASLGASGAILGIIGTLTILEPLMTVFAFSLPMPMFIASILWIAADIFGIFFPSGTANLAHLSGIAIGIILGIVFRVRHYKKLKTRAEYSRINLSEQNVRNWEDRYLR